LSGHKKSNISELIVNSDHSNSKDYLAKAMKFKIGAVIWRLLHRKIKNTPSMQTSLQKKELCTTWLLLVVLEIKDYHQVLIIGLSQIGSN
jgi:hypothetical protein